MLDGFGITAGLRDCEKARRNRASKVRAAAVQGYGRLSTETRGHGIEKDLNGAHTPCYLRRLTGWDTKIVSASVYAHSGMTRKFRLRRRVRSSKEGQKSETRDKVRDKPLLAVVRFLHTSAMSINCYTAYEMSAPSYATPVPLILLPTPPPPRSPRLPLATAIAAATNAAPSSVPLADEVRHLPIICLTSKASPDDLRSYMAAGMDGCVSKPVEPGPLLNTLRAAVPLHLSPASADGRPLMDGVPDGASFVAPTKGGEFVRGGGGGTTIRAIHGKGLGVLTGSAAAAAEGMVLAGGRKADDSVEGVLQIDADTSVPYCIVGSPPSSGSSGGRYFNLVVCHDLFDNYERTKIILAPVIARYPGAQVITYPFPAAPSPFAFHIPRQVTFYVSSGIS